MTSVKEEEVETFKRERVVRHFWDDRVKEGC